MLTVHCLEIVAEAATPLDLDPYCGSATRGAFFRAIWGRFCTNRESPECRVCPLVTACPVSALVAPLRDEGVRGHDIPRPYVISPPYKEEKHRYEQGETFSFHLALVGTSTKLFPYIIRSIQEMEHFRLGHPLAELKGSRGQFRIREIRAYDPLTNERQILWENGSVQVQKPKICLTSDTIAKRAQQLPSDHITIHFLSPTRLIARDHLLFKPDFRVLMLRLADRFEQLEKEYGDNSVRGKEPQVISTGREWYLQIEALASKVRLVREETQWVDIKSYSSRLRHTTPIGGFVGRASFEGDITHLRELLVWGEVLHVGKNIVKGAGQYRLEV